MKRRIILAIASMTTGCLTALGQGTFVFDQQSATEGTPQDGGGYLQLQPFGQSFTPTNSSVGFVRFWLSDLNPGNSLGATIVVNLRSNSITGPVFGSTTPVLLPDGFGIGSNGYVNFFFSAPIAVNPGTTYYFQPFIQTGGDSWVAFGGTYGYSGGALYVNGNPGSLDLWFREGIVVPEPSSLSFLIGSGALVYIRSIRKRSYDGTSSANRS